MPGPKRPHSITSATSLTIGELIRKAKVTPRGTPASTKPMKRGTAEHEQNGVTMPSPAAANDPGTRPRPASTGRIRSGGKKPRISVTTVTMPRSRSKTFGRSSRKKATASPRWVPGWRPMTVKVSQSAAGASTNQATTHARTAAPATTGSGSVGRRSASVVIAAGP